MAQRENYKEKDDLLADSEMKEFMKESKSMEGDMDLNSTLDQTDLVEKRQGGDIYKQKG